MSLVWRLEVCGTDGAAQPPPKGGVAVAAPPLTIFGGMALMLLRWARQKLYAFILLPIAIETLFASPPPVSSERLWGALALIMRTHGKAVLFIMDGLSYRHIFSAQQPAPSTPHSYGLSSFGEIGEWLESKGSIALLNTMGYGGVDRFRAAMTLACGVRAFGDETATLVFQANEPMEADTALNAYRRRVGNFELLYAREPFKPLVFPMLAELKWRNEKMQKKPLPFGVVAQSLRQKGIRIAAIGCGDVPQLAQHQFRQINFRHPLLIALDENGLGVGLTEPQKLLCKDPSMPFGIAVDERRWSEAVGEAWWFADLIVLYPGETFRADLYGSERLIPLVIRRELNLLRPVIERLNIERDLLLVFSLAPSRKSRYELSFICAVGKGIEQGGVLTSQTTHQHGVVSVLDIPATVLKFFGAEPVSPINGSPILSIPSNFDLPRHLFGIGEAARITDGWLRVTVLATWCVLQAIVFAALAVISLMGQKAKIPSEWQVPLALLAWFPLVVHLACSGVNATMASLLWRGIGQIVLSAIFVLVAAAASRNSLPINSIFGAVLLSSLFFASDAIGSGFLSINTPFGYSLFFGGRYYGLGNVVMGLTLGAIYALALALNWQRWATAGFCFVGAILVGAPFFGANIGGALTGIVIALTTIFAGRFRWWHFLVAVAALVALLGGFSVFELACPEPLTHWGRFIRSVAEGGLMAFASMVWTKISISLRVFRAIHWDIAFLAQLLLLAVLWWQQGRCWKLSTLMAGIIAALLFNDSGPQTPVAFAFLPLCFLASKSLANLRSLPTREPLG